MFPGDALGEARLAKRFEVSRTPVREALLQLSAQAWSGSFRVRASTWRGCRFPGCSRCSSCSQNWSQNLFLRTARIDVSHADHQKVVDAIASGDAESAAQHMLEHISIGGKDFAEFVSTLPADFLEPGASMASGDDQLIGAAGD